MTTEQIKIDIIRNIDFHGNTSWNYPTNYYPYNTLYFILDGDGFVRVGEQTTPLEKGHVYLIPANTMFSCWCNHSIHKLYIDVNAQIVPGFDVFSGRRELMALPYSLSKIKKLIEVSTHTSLKGGLYLRGELSLVLSAFMDEDFVLPDMRILHFKPLLDDIEQHLSAQLKVRDIADRYNYNISVLSRNFKKAFHCSLKRYIEKLLLSKIKQELLLTNRTIKEISFAYDFCDPYYMSGFFKKLEGCSPSQYRKDGNHLENQLIPSQSCCNSLNSEI